MTTRRAVLTLAALALSACGGDKKPAGAAASVGTDTALAAVTPVADKGAATYAQICQSCHQATGLGVEGTYPPLKASPWLVGNADVPIAIVLAGLQGEMNVEGKAFNGIMQSWAMLSDEDIAAVLTYARSQWGNAATPIAPAQVKAVRDRIGNHSAWTSAELKKEYPGAGG